METNQAVETVLATHEISLEKTVQENSKEIYKTKKKKKIRHQFFADYKNDSKVFVEYHQFDCNLNDSVFQQESVQARVE